MGCYDGSRLIFKACWPWSNFGTHENERKKIEMSTPNELFLDLRVKGADRPDNVRSLEAGWQPSCPPKRGCYHAAPGQVKVGLTCLAEYEENVVINASPL